MDPIDVTPLRTDPADIPDPDRRRAHTRRYTAQHTADGARNDVIDAMTRAGVTHTEARRLADALIMAVRRADALRLEYARGHMGWSSNHRPGEGSGMVDFLYTTAHAYPVQSLDADAP